MKSDLQIQNDVMEELKWDPFLNSSAIGVSVKNGIVTLSGQVDSFTKKLTAEKAAKRVAGVKAIAEDIKVGASSLDCETDTEIAEAVLNALKWHSAVPQDNIKIKVEDGFVTLEGEVEWEYQRNTAKLAIEHLKGVRYVLNVITLKPTLKVSDIQKKISAAFSRSATIDASKIDIEAVGNKVILKGKVRSFAEKADAENAAWAAPGVTDVESRLELEIPSSTYSE